MLWGSDGYVSPYRFHYETTQSPGESSNLPPFCFNSTKSSQETFDKSNIYKAAEELKYSTLIKKVFEDEFDTPSDEFVRFVLNDIYTGKKNKNMVEKFKPMVRKAFSAFINDIVNQKLNEVFDTM